ncbi:ATP-binding protein [Actinomadura sp. NBRC 104412]|uniref:ATP-binding protein n=1 Tax=Actinomadura sp. NBRC 104412 TaxID=3032203 RepID=UPI0025570F85|nr:ATP-binding protein [Actinomadura sp. NBRC 104412]
MPTLVLAPSGRAPALARRFVAEHFRECSLDDDYGARVVVTELVTNAYWHGEGVIVVRAFLDEGKGAVMVEVWDQGAGMPVVRTENVGATSGRGLLMMSRLVREWGTRPITEGGKIVWARCPLERPRFVLPASPGTGKV